MWPTHTHTHSMTMTMIQCMYICKTGQPIFFRPGPNHSSTLSRETNSQPLSLATEVTEENTWPWCIHPSLHPSLPSFIHCPPPIPSLLNIQQQWNACMHMSPDFMGPLSGREKWLPPIYAPVQDPRLSILMESRWHWPALHSSILLPQTFIPII